MDPKAVIDALCGMDEQTCSSVITAVLETRPELAPSVVSFAVPDLTWAPAKAVSERRSRGVVKGLNPQLGFGLIASPELQMVFGNDVFVHSRQLGRFQAGQQVEFAVFLGRDNMPQAYDLQDPAAPVARVGGMLLMQQQALVQQQLVATGGAGALGAASAPAACLGGAALAGTMPAALGQAVPVLPGVLPAGPPQPGPPPGAPPPRKRPRPSDSQVIGQYQGVVTSFSAANGFGFIACDAVRAMGHQNDVLLHHSEAAGVEVGRQVRFTCFLNGKGSPEAMDLTLAGGVPPMQPVPGPPPSRAPPAPGAAPG